MQVDLVEQSTPLASQNEPSENSLRSSEPEDQRSQREVEPVGLQNSKVWHCCARVRVGVCQSVKLDFSLTLHPPSRSSIKIIPVFTIQDGGI